MLTSLRIQNFRSIRDASVKLGQVNLFIGPNNSGKSNFLKGITMFGTYLTLFPRNYDLPSEKFQTLLPRTDNLSERKSEIIRFAAQVDKDEQVASLAVGYAYDYRHDYDEREVEGKLVRDISGMPSIESPHTLNDFFTNDQYFDDEYIPKIVWDAQAYFKNLVLYKIEPSSFLFSTALSSQSVLDSTGKNITAFLYTLSQNHEDKFANLRVDFARCVGSLSSVSAPPDPNTAGNLRLKFFDFSRRSYWAEEVSEGVLYFLALLCIVHQPDPPKLLLLEEPEKGIHPRRIREVMDFIFELAHLRDIQIILTSHSPYVVDYFRDIPECISVFDRNRETGETIVNNAGELIDASNAANDAKGLPRISYTNALGEYWVSGFLGGVPL